MINTDTASYTASPTSFTIAAPVQQTPRARIGLTSRIAARVFAHYLDRQLAAECPPRPGTALSAHAARLESGRERDRVATWLQTLLARALSPERPSPGYVHPNYSAIVEERAIVRRIISLLADRTRPVNAPGVARLRILLSDGTGPLYRGERSGLIEELHVINATI